MDSLQFALERIYNMTAIPVRVINCVDKKVIFIRGYALDNDPLRSIEIKESFCKKAEQIELPFIYSENNICAYGVMKDPTNCVIVFGPYALGTISRLERQGYAIQHKVPYENFSMMSGPILLLTSSLSFLLLLRTGKEITETEVKFYPSSNTTDTDKLIKENDVTNHIMQNVEEEFRLLDYQDEFLYLKQIREGDVDGINRVFDMNFNLDTIGRMAKDPLKRFEYMICASITLATRAAIDGGLDFKTAYAISDLYMQRLETCKSIRDFFTVQMEMRSAYAMQVKTVRETRSKSSDVEKCKVYIANHLNKPFELDDIAKELDINKSHLSRKFKKETKMSIMEYTRIKRIEAAANMLKNSNETISIIAHYLCFQSQSHFGAVFKTIKGVTPQKYRDMEQIT